MKLFTKYNRINVISTVIIFLIGCIAFAVLLRYVVISQIDEDLKIEKNEILTYVARNKHLPGIIEVRDQYTTYEQVASPVFIGKSIYTKEAYSTAEQEKEIQRIIKFNVNVNGRWFLVSVSKSLAGTDDLIHSIIIITITLILLILITTFFINRFVLRRLWQPFYETLQSMQNFNLSETQAIHFKETAIDEFNYLNKVSANAMTKAQRDYQTLKEFTENASHEMQTPIAVIRSKLDMLIQNENFSEADSKYIQNAYTALQGLSKLSQSLLLLAKIENNQFNEKADFDLKELLESKINQFDELWKGRNIVIDCGISNCMIHGNFYLLDILLNNLLSNATKYNIQQGTILIYLVESRLTITNTGANHALNKDALFKRFAKQNSTSESHGLGLSIIYQICQASGFTCTYNFKEPDQHIFSISF
ncbi:type IX secretion system histidine kinase PorY [Parafilimonas sp.]|uniref:sensor histidine kinase n=1 Tax=Parafilimonas sp. TaxID=1969739 RepID=UPI003F807F13